MRMRPLLAAAIVFGIANGAFAAETTVRMRKTAQIGLGPEIGTVKLADSPYGLLITPDLDDVEPGIHGFHVHENPDCEAAMSEEKMIPGLAAGGHFDPMVTGSHEGPYGAGHLGDLPVLIVDEQGRATLPLLAPRPRLAEIRDRSLVIHAGGDNYSDAPKLLGGGGRRIACGIIPAE